MTTNIGIVLGPEVTVEWDKYNHGMTWVCVYLDNTWHHRLTFYSESHAAAGRFAKALREALVVGGFCAQEEEGV